MFDWDLLNLRHSSINNNYILLVPLILAIYLYRFWLYYYNWLRPSCNMGLLL